MSHLEEMKRYVKMYKGHMQINCLFFSKRLEHLSILFSVWGLGVVLRTDSLGVYEGMVRETLCAILEVCGFPLRSLGSRLRKSSIDLVPSETSNNSLGVHRCASNDLFSEGFQSEKTTLSVPRVEVRLVKLRMKRNCTFLLTKVKVSGFASELCFATLPGKGRGRVFCSK